MIIEVSREVTPGRLVLVTMEVETAKSSGTPFVVSQVTQLAVLEGLIVQQRRYVNVQQYKYVNRKSRNYLLFFFVLFFFFFLFFGGGGILLGF